jgi:Tfp pilus assembly protein PilN
MTAMTQDTTLVRVSLGVLPRVNLLPPEIGEARKFRQIQIGLGAAVVGAMGVVALLSISAGHGVTSAQTKLDASTSQGARITAESVKYRDVSAVYARAATAQQMLVTAMGDEVRFSGLLNDMSLSIPENVWITSLSYGPAAAPPAGVAPTSIGILTVAGTAFAHDDVASWLESIAAQKSYLNPYFSNSTEGFLGSKAVVNFSGTATVTPAALSHRYDKAGS